ncbi:single-stranded-DNA-specific exonuclease RecJ [Clostridium cylindrosporum]|uniref:Single-stranded-DNA-specific exonuclease RecJ n=1 Tax=Clostridium cylindrosporum DSM 605 TaxID=1121307 RepID=A0A0J8G0F5_CLOCY|nr:single-stranded-DNA-specific exonuclease RecJ [Clostridium cylindrosporum]KMT21271.1 single-stranded-DNA-specific exonuclease RecJ [Clostridium cylindrosporum DSM 605]
MKKWMVKKTKTEKEKLHSNEFLNRLLHIRGIEDNKGARLFLDPSMGNLNNPFLLKDMDKAIERIDEVIKKGQKIVIYGDYDVDGITSTSILFRAFKKLGIDVSYYIPDRLDEGYGLNIEAVTYLKSLQTDLIITVDCGISALEEVDYIKSLGMDVIITDHHECREEIPDTIVINPKRQDCTYPCKNLAGCGVAFKLIQALWMYYNIDGVDEFLDIAAIGTIADIVELRGENRIIAKHGMEKLKTTDKCGLIALKSISGLEDNITSGNIAFQIAPRINAIGRLRDAKIAVELFITCDSDKAMQIAKYLDQENRSRQKIEEEILNEAIIKISQEVDLQNDRVIVVSSTNWHLGVVGIVASKIVDIFHRPTIILCEEGDMARGSGRSIEGFNLFKALVECEDVLQSFGGHEMAAGLKVNTSNIKDLREKLNSYGKRIDPDVYLSKLNIDMMLDSSDINFENLDAIKALEPFGEGNPTPVFGIEDIQLLSKRYVGSGEKHIKLQFIKNEVYYDGILFNYGKNYMHKDWENVDIAFNMDENNWMGKKSIQFIVRDMKPYKSWMKSNLKDNYYKYLKSIQNSHDEEVSMENIKFISKDTDFVKEFLCFEKGHVLVSSRESLDELDYFLDLFDFSGNVVKDDSRGIVICPDISKIDFSSDVLIYDFLPGGAEYKILLEKVPGDVYHFYDNNLFEKIDNYIDEIEVKNELIDSIISFLVQGEICGRLSDISKDFNANPFLMYNTIVFLRRKGVVEILSNGDIIKIKLKEDISNIDLYDIDNIMTQKIKRVESKLKELTMED